jgi:hypothetical protein
LKPAGSAKGGLYLKSKKSVNTIPRHKTQALQLFGEALRQKKRGAKAQQDCRA